MAEYIYTRVSTDGQTSEGQTLALLQKYPNAQVISEVASGAKTRPMLNALIDELKPGDTLIVAALDRLGRRASEALNLIESLQERGVNLVSVREGVDYSTPVGRLVTQILVSVAEMERAMISERTKAGLKAAASNGRKGGRPARIPKDTRAQIREMYQSGLSMEAVAQKTGVSKSSVFKITRSH